MGARVTGNVPGDSRHVELCDVARGVVFDVGHDAKAYYTLITSSLGRNRYSCIYMRYFDIIHEMWKPQQTYLGQCKAFCYSLWCCKFILSNAVYAGLSKNQVC